MTSYLESFSPWNSRSTTPKPGPKQSQAQGKESDLPQEGQLQQHIDHTVTHRHGISLRDYPEDCPKSLIKWFYAVDAPKRRPLALGGQQKDGKPIPPPKKYAVFSARDSRSIETAFQRMAEAEDDAAQQDSSGGDLGLAGHKRAKSIADVGSSRNTSINNSTNIEKGGLVKVPVNEDFLFDVDIEHRELAPTYWLGPIYDVRRGSWFYQEGSTLRPCDENLASQLEEGYLKVKPWRNAPVTQQNPTSKAKSSSANTGQTSKSAEDGRTSPKAGDSGPVDGSIPAKFELQTQRLFGTYMNSVVTYQDAIVAWVLTDDFLSRMSSTVYSRFAGGGHLGGTKVVRGYSELNKTKDASKKDPDLSKDAKRRSAPPQNEASSDPPSSKTPTTDASAATNEEPKDQPRLLTLERQMSSSLSSLDSQDPAKQEEETRKRDEDEISEDYKNADGQDQAREIEHLILVTHGIGQRLGFESINFIHDVNVLRKTIKAVYDGSPDLQALNNEIDTLPKNCRIQVLPVVWRHLLAFPKQSTKESGEQDLTDADKEEEYPSLEAITVEGVPALGGVTRVIRDLALDILLYQSAYRDHIAEIVQRESNRVYELFLQRNPTFAPTGKVSLIGHSLGSAILFDLLCQQKDRPSISGPSSTRRRQFNRSQSGTKPKHLDLNFDVEDFYCLGSPLGLYQMLKGCKIAGRSLKGPQTQGSMDREAMDDPFLGSAVLPTSTPGESDSLSITISSPKCTQLFNIFHPADPVAYRVEPLVSNAMTSLKPQQLPYTKKGYLDFQGQGITGIPARVGQSVSGFWSSMTSGVASSLLNRSLGLTGDGKAASLQASAPQIQPRQGAPNASSTNSDTEPPEHPPTLIDGEIETLYAGFEKRRKSHQSDGARDLGESAEWLEAEQRARKLRTEEGKVQTLNSNGRIDYAIQEGMLDISVFAAFASHLSYWSDEDVSHFMISQLLSRQRVIKR